MITGIKQVQEDKIKVPLTNHMTNEYWTIIYRTTNNSDF